MAQSKTINVFTTFSGYDSQMLALRRLSDYSGGELSFDLVGWSEIDKNAIKAHDALFPEYASRNYGDITKISWSDVPDFDLLTYSSPCQDFSVAGMQKGGEKGSGTRSSLLWEIEHAIAAKHPKYLLMENVDALTSLKFRPLLKMWLATLSQYGYTNHVKVLNAKDYGVPQNRNRVFVLSIQGDGFQRFNWPIPQKLTRRLRDVLENDVDESFYLTAKQLAYFQKKDARPVNAFHFRPKTKDSEIANTLVTSKGWGNPSDNYIDMRGGIVMREGYYSPSQQGCSSVVVNNKGISPTVLHNHNSVTATESQQGRIRKLTPREFYRLMDVDDADIDKILTAINGKSVHYKLAGNSIVVAVLFQIFRKLLWEPENESQQLNLF